MRVTITYIFHSESHGACNALVTGDYWPESSQYGEYFDWDDVRLVIGATQIDVSNLFGEWTLSPAQQSEFVELARKAARELINENKADIIYGRAS